MANKPDKTSKTNKAIVQELKSGQRVGCASLVGKYQSRLIYEAVYLFRLAKEDAEELASDVLVSVVRNIHGFEFRRGEKDFDAWVITLFRNKLRDFIRHRALTDGILHSFDESGLEKESEYSKLEMEVAAAIVRQYEEAVRRPENTGEGAVGTKLLAIADALECLDPWERVLLRCRAMDVPYNDIAEYTGKPAKQLKVYYARVRKKFVKMLSTYYPELHSDEKRTD